MDTEIWKDISGYIGYQVSSMGRVRTLDKVVNCGYGKKRVSKGKILKLMRHNCGYIQVSLYKNGIRKVCTIHRLVAKEFIENISFYKTVNHKNSIKTDNRVENLEWCTQSENIKHFYTNHPRKKKFQSGNKEPLISLLQKI